MYLDHAQYADPNARGLMWATRFSNLWKAFSFRPLEMYKSGLYDYWGNKITTGCTEGVNENGADYVCATLQRPENIVGLGGCLWSEEIIDEDYLWNQMFPRVFALAERAYKNASWELTPGKNSWDLFEEDEFLVDFAQFRYAMKFELMDLEKRGITYQLPKPGGKVSNGNWGFNNLYTYNDIMFRELGTKTWKDYSDIKGKMSMYKIHRIICHEYPLNIFLPPLRQWRYII